MAKVESATEIVKQQSREVISLPPTGLAMPHLREEVAPAFYSDWTSYLSHKHIYALAASRNELWAATGSGVVRWRWQDKALFYTCYGSEHGLSGGLLNCLSLDDQGRPWVGGRGAGLCYLDGTHWRVMPCKDASRDILCMTRAPTGELWVGTTRGLGKISPQQNRWQPYDLSDTPLPAPEIRALAITPAGTLWIGTAWGLYRHEPTDDPSDDPWQRYTQADGLADNHVSPLLFWEDCLWIGTAGGQSTFDGQQMVDCPQIGGAVSSLSVNRVTGDLWLVAAGTLWHLCEGSWQSYEPSPLKGKWRAVATNDAGALYLADDKGLVQQGQPTARLFSLPARANRPTAINCLSIDSISQQARLWVGTSSGLWVAEARFWRRYQAGNELDSPLREIDAIAVSPTDEVWVGSWLKEAQGGGLRYLMDGVEEPRAKANSPDCAEALTFESNGTLWVAAEALIWSKEGKTWREPIESPVPDELVQALLVSQAGRLWCASTGALHYYAAGKWHAVLDELAVEVNALACQTNGTLWIGTSQGLYVKRNGTPERSSGLAI